MEIRKELPRNLKCLHVKGHQDSKVNSEIRLEDNLNILMDTRAKKAQTTTLSLSEHQLDFTVTLNNERITGSFVKEIRKILSQDCLKQFYEKKWQKDHKTIMWDLLFKAIKSKKPGRVIIKMIHNLTPTQQFMQKCGLSPDAMCFFCNKYNETIPHILVCPYRKENHIEICYDKTCKKLKITSEEEKRKIHRIITTMILGPQHNETKEKFKQQLKHGWDKVIRGFLTHEWQTEIDQLSETIKNPEGFSIIIMTLWETWENAWKQRNIDFNPTDRYDYQQREYQTTIDLNIIYQCRQYLDQEIANLLEAKVENHIKQELLTKEGWLLMNKTIFKQNIDLIDGEIWNLTQNEILEELQSNFNNENDNEHAETDQEKANKGRSRIQELNPSPIPGDQTNCVTPDQDTSMDD
jgi:hypothetical protein